MADSMRKFQLLILASAVAAGAIWWGFYRTHHTSSLAVASLLPKETLALVHVPDFNRSRDEWHRTDLYQLWKEPAVQEFLAKPRSKVPTEGRISQTVAVRLTWTRLRVTHFIVCSWPEGLRKREEPSRIGL